MLLEVKGISKIAMYVNRGCKVVAMEYKSSQKEWYAVLEMPSREEVEDHENTYSW